MSDQPQTCGLTVDSMKCYNCIPRYPLIVFMAKLGWPIFPIKTFLAALTALRRSFLVLGHCSDWQISHAGIPEGCALAVASMLTINAALYFTYSTGYLKPSCLPLPIIGPSNFLVSWVHLPPRMPAALALQLSVPKSWTWATKKAVANQLESLQLQGSRVPNIQHTKDLGVDITCRGRKRKNHLKHRLQLGLNRCTKIQQSNIPKNRSARLLQCRCYPKAAFGIELRKSDTTTYNRYRSNAKKSMGYTWHHCGYGILPVLALLIGSPPLKNGWFMFSPLNGNIMYVDSSRGGIIFMQQWLIQTVSIKMLWNLILKNSPF